jgi:ubiquinone biosynthesis monooxygenase Coq7
MTPSSHNFSILDTILTEVDHALRTAFAPPPQSTRPNPAGNIQDSGLPTAEKSLSEGLMRINHTGEIAAQALYRGQAAVARDAEQRAKLLKAADEEQDHLLWCKQRLDELGSQPSRLAPVWYFGSFIIGVSAGLAGDQWSMGFVEETENQVSTHLDDHLQRLSEDDQRSRAIVAKMREDEARHADAAREAGAKELPQAVKIAMTNTANIMRFISFRF